MHQQLYGDEDSCVDFFRVTWWTDDNKDRNNALKHWHLSATSFEGGSPPSSSSSTNSSSLAVAAM